MHRPTLIVSLLAVAIALSPGASAQPVTHDLSVSTPSYVGLRLVGSGTGPRSVTFDYAADPNAYLSAIDGTVNTLPPTATSRFDDIEVSVIGVGFWSLYVQATPLDYSGPGSGAGLELADIRVNRGSVSGLTQSAIPFLFWVFGSYETAWPLATTPRRIAGSLFGTSGWRSLGFNGQDYTLAVDGDEDAGTYTTTVTYFLTFP